LTRKVAILAVHGVGKHAAGETEDSVVDLLLSIPGRHRFSSGREYSAFETTDIQIPLQPLQTSGGVYIPSKRSFGYSLTHLYQEQSADFAEKAKTQATGQPGEAGLHYTDQLLRSYLGGADTNVYRTTRLEGEKTSTGDGVHIYEVLWADLAKPNNTVITFFLSLFQLILHLASLSRLAIDSGAAEGSGPVWAAYRTVQRYAVRLLQIFIPVMEIIMVIALAASLIEVWLVTQGHLWVMIGLSLLAAIGLGVLSISRARRVVIEHPWIWALRALSPLVLGLGIPLLGWALWVRNSPDVALRADVAGAALFWLVPGFGFLLWILSKYEDSRKGVLATGLALFFISFACFIVYTVHIYHSLEIQSPPPTVVLVPTLWIGNMLLAAVRTCWGLMVLCAFAASILGSISWRSMKRKKPNGPEWGRARAAVRTSRLALALPTTLFLLVTLLIWAGFLATTHELMPVGASIFSEDVANRFKPPAFLQGTTAERIFPPSNLNKKDSHYLRPKKDICDDPQNDYASRVFAWTMGYHLPITLALLSVTAFLMLWWALPSVLTESPVCRGVNEAPRDTSDKDSVRMGTWMSRGLDATSVVTMLLWTAIFLVPFLYILVDHVYCLDDTFGPITYAIVTNTLLGFALLALIAKRGQTVLSTILDVDTYLRTSPIYATPRATIFERYISTLRYLRAYRDEQGHGYDQIIIIAHSLGASISGDLLFYLQSEEGHKEWYAPAPPGPKFTTIPITLFTVGNPLRQLLNRFFPYLYDWVRPVPDNGQHPLPPPTSPGHQQIGDDALPDPAALGLTHWVNAYRSGDYVGRSVWLDEWYHRPAYDANTPVPHVTVSPAGNRGEMCIGAGAHIHYLDDTAPDIAWMLDSLI
jgi:hypothetical protein